MKIVCNSTPIISLATVKRIDILQELFDNIYIPQAVYDELKAKEAPGYKDVESDIFLVKVVEGKKYLGFLEKDMDTGESEAILLAHEIQADMLIIDERAGFYIAKSQGINVIGTLSILVMAKEFGVIDAVKPLLDEMIREGRWYSKKLYREFLLRIGELE